MDRKRATLLILPHNEHPYHQTTELEKDKSRVQPLEFGIDITTWTTGPVFRGVKDIPIGLHFFHCNQSNYEIKEDKCNQKENSNGQIGNIRISYFKFFTNDEICVCEWDSENERLIIQNELDEMKQLNVSKNMDMLNHMLGSYLYSTNAAYFNINSKESNMNLTQQNKILNEPITSYTESLYKIYSVFYMPRICKSTGNLIYGLNLNDLKSSLQLTSSLIWISLSCCITPLTLRRLLDPNIPSFNGNFKSIITNDNKDFQNTEFIYSSPLYKVSSIESISQYSDIDLNINNIKDEDNDAKLNNKNKIHFLNFNLKKSFPINSNQIDITKYSQDKSWLVRNLIYQKDYRYVFINTESNKKETSNEKTNYCILDDIYKFESIYNDSITYQLNICLRILGCGYIYHIFDKYKNTEDKEDISKIKEFIDNPILKPDYSNIKIEDYKEREIYSIFNKLFNKYPKCKHHYLSYLEFLGEIQFSFILFLYNYNYDGLQHWKNLIYLILTSDELIDTDPLLLIMFHRIFIIQLNQLPKDLFEDILLNDNFLKDSIIILSMNLLLRTKSKTPYVLQLVIDNLFNYIKDKFSWDVISDAEFKLNEEEDILNEENEYAPIILDS